MFSEKQLYDLFGFYEESRFIRIAKNMGDVVLCVHPQPVIATTDSKLQENTFFTQTSVVLQHYRIRFGDYSLAGKCNVCGKVYYR